MRTLITLGDSLLVLSLASCASPRTTLADRMPVAVETVTWVLDRVDEDLTAVHRDLRGMSGMGERAESLLNQEHLEIADRIDRTRQTLAEAKRDVDAHAFQRAVDEVEILQEKVAALRRSMWVAKAASGKRK